MKKKSLRNHQLALQMQLLRERIEEFNLENDSDDETSDCQFEELIAEKERLLKQYFGENFGPNVLPISLQPS